MPGGSGCRRSDTARKSRRQAVEEPINPDFDLMKGVFHQQVLDLGKRR
ncbi:MAG: hypothetical protein L0241_06220 [Planctomycetia bacterium]|nr:hypothetical protein [Planctomycetia bacterium]